jgi:hypothetical protein
MKTVRIYISVRLRWLHWGSNCKRVDGLRTRHRLQEPRLRTL